MKLPPLSLVAESANGKEEIRGSGPRREGGQGEEWVEVQE